MIKLINEPEKISATNPFGIRIKALNNAYADTDICDFYIDTKTGGAMAKCGDVLILDAENGIDREQLKSFCDLAAVKTVLCSGELDFGDVTKTEGYILKYKGIEICPDFDNAAFNENIRDIYSLICDNLESDLSKIGFDTFYVDLSHKLRHGSAASAVIYNDEGDTPCSCAVAPFVCGEGAVISSVCTDKKFRRRGYGSVAVYALIAWLKEMKVSDVYLQIEDKSLLDFYYPMGFAAVGTWQEIKI